MSEENQNKLTAEEEALLAEFESYNGTVADTTVEQESIEKSVDMSDVASTKSEEKPKMQKNSRLTSEEEDFLREFEDGKKETKEQETEDEAEELVEMVTKEMTEQLDVEVKKEVDKKVENKKEMNLDMDALRKQIEEETRAKFEVDMRAKIEEETKKQFEEKVKVEMEAKLRVEIEKEKNKKQEEILVKLSKIEQIEKTQNAQSATSEEEIREKLREEMKAEMEVERKKKQETLLKKLETVSKGNKVIQLQKEKAKQDETKAGGLILSHSEKIIVLKLFEEIQRIFAELLTSYMNKKKVENLFFKSVDTAMKKNPDSLKKAITDNVGKLRTDGTLEIARVIANINAIPSSEDRRAKAFFRGLRDIFEERLIGAEMATDLETKDRIMSELVSRMSKIFTKNDYNKKIGKIFMTYIVPDTSLLSEDT